MSRIRSIHPGVWTDEEFVSLSAFARLLFMGLWNECDDKGIFEWKPLTIKMRLLAADNIDITELLGEIEAVGSIRRYEIDGKVYGAVRNFRKFQKPKTPNDIHPATAEILAYAGLISEAELNEGGSFPPKGEAFPQKEEKSRLMEEGGGNSSSVANATDGEVVADPVKIMFDAGVSLIKSAGKSESAARSWLGKVRKDHGPEAVIVAIGAAKREGAIDPISFMEASLRARERHSAREWEFTGPC